MTKYKKYTCKHCGTEFKVSKHDVKKAKELARKYDDPRHLITCPRCGSFPNVDMSTGSHRPEYIEDITEDLF